QKVTGFRSGVGAMEGMMANHIMMGDKEGDGLSSLRCPITETEKIICRCKEKRANVRPSAELTVDQSRTMQISRVMERAMDRRASCSPSQQLSPKQRFSNLIFKPDSGDDRPSGLR
ncbi:hypothetical protein HAX54_043565, partial [Datura stramonium]|nr:hypothetical protein [Datura stramonium]